MVLNSYLGSVDNSSIVQYKHTQRPAACPRDPVRSVFVQQDFELFKISGYLTAWANEPNLPRKKRGTCGAKTRKGTLCQAPPVWSKATDKAKNGRCKMHGGLSTGAKTEAGRQAIRDGVSASNRRRHKHA